MGSYLRTLYRKQTLFGRRLNPKKEINMKLAAMILLMGLVCSVVTMSTETKERGEADRETAPGEGHLLRAMRFTSNTEQDRGCKGRRQYCTQSSQCCSGGCYMNECE